MMEKNTTIKNIKKRDIIIKMKTAKMMRKRKRRKRKIQLILLLTAWITILINS